MTTQSSTIKKGIITIMLANFLFAAVYLFSTWMLPLTGTDVFIWRTVSMLVGLLIILKITDRIDEMKSFLRELLISPKKATLVLLPTPILASQLWLFVWGPVNNYAIDVALGYFLLPLTIVGFAWLLLKETITKIQLFALFFATLSVCYKLFITQVFSLVTFWICATYPIYYLLRRYQNIPSLIGLSFDLMIIAPFSICYLIYTGEINVLFQPSKFWILIPLLGLFSALAMQLNLSASQLLPIPMFGMLTYVEPALMFILSITILDSPITLPMLITFGLLWCGLIISMLDGWIKIRTTTA